jgi:DNA-binding LytR/AlgR family response regulator
MKNIISKLPADMFIRVHKSYIVSFKNIRKIENNRIIIGEKYIPIGEQFKTDFYNYVNKNRL